MSARELLASGAGIILVDEQIITVSGNWTKVAAVKPTDKVIVDIWSGGGSGAKSNQNDELYGGQGGAHLRLEFFAFELPSSVACIIGAGGAPVSVNNNNGNDGGASSFGAFSVPGGGGGLYSGQGAPFGHNRSAALISAVSLLPNIYDSSSFFPQPYTITQNPNAPLEIGGFWSFKLITNTRYLTSARRVYAGAVGGAYSQDRTYSPPGVSLFGGAGGEPAPNNSANASAGQIPGGGGGAKDGAGSGNSGAGARGEIRVRVLRGAS